MIKPPKIISGGQTGVDRAALDAAMAAGIALGGWCPKGRLAEDGPLPDHYPLEETSSHRYRQRTQWNVRDSDGTLVLYWGELQGGTLATVKLADQYRRPLRIVNLLAPANVAEVAQWITSNNIKILNVARKQPLGHLQDGARLLRTDAKP
jgi:predicted Rossmann fold nucleotide-binding protein DprA/Smf involved in DNA uptake